jgi:hypothetical protein
MPDFYWAHPAQAPDRAFRFNSSDLPIANPAGLSASIPCADEKWHPCHFSSLSFCFANSQGSIAAGILPAPPGNGFPAIFHL